MATPYPQYPAVFTDVHTFYLCRCGETVMLSIWGADVRTCACGRRHTWDGEQIAIIRPEGEREHPAPQKRKKVWVLRLVLAPGSRRTHLLPSIEERLVVTGDDDSVMMDLIIGGESPLWESQTTCCGRSGPFEPSPLLGRQDCGSCSRGLDHAWDDVPEHLRERRQLRVTGPEGEREQ